MMEPVGRWFRFSFLHSVAITLLPAIVVLVAFVAFGVLVLNRSLTWKVAIPFLVVTGAIGLGMSINVFLYQVQVSEAGLQSYTARGKYHFFSWEEIDKIVPINVLGLRYLRVSNHDSQVTIWVPRFLSDRQGFKEEITRLAGENHPFVKAWGR